MVLLLMAAGRGSRYGKLKQFDEMGPNGEFLMEFSIYDAIENGFDHIIVVTSKDNVDFLRNYLSDRLPTTVKLDIVPQEITDLPEPSEFSGKREKPWGTAHAVWSARGLISTPFVVINADDYYGKKAYTDSAQFIRTHLEGTGFGLVGYALNNTLSEHGSVSRGVCNLQGNTLRSVKEHTQLERQNGHVIDRDSGAEFTGEELVSMNFWICRPSLFEHIEHYFKQFLKDQENIAGGEVYLPFVIQEMVQRQQVSVEVIPSNGNWFGVTYANDKETSLQRLKEMTEAGRYASPLWK
ncbi:sugar phosphate nucleotidyltransferase [Flavobacteriaceae bacterium 3-367]